MDCTMTGVGGQLVKLRQGSRLGLGQQVLDSGRGGDVVDILNCRSTQQVGDHFQLRRKRRINNILDNHRQCN